MPTASGTPLLRLSYLSELHLVVGGVADQTREDFAIGQDLGHVFLVDDFTSHSGVADLVGEIFEGRKLVTLHVNGHFVQLGCMHLAAVLAQGRVLVGVDLLGKMLSLARALRNPALDLGVHLGVGHFDLLLHEFVGLLLHFGVHLVADVLALLHLLDLLLVLTLDHIHLFGQLLFGFLLPGDPGLRFGQLLRQLLFLRQGVELERSAF